jgi:two-component system response regulator FixJ
MRILIIEDDRQMARNIRTVLAKNKLSIEIAGTGAEGQSLVDSEAFDLVLLDLSLPDIHGRELLQRFRAASMKFPIIIITGDAAVDTRIGCLDAGADDFLTKPFHLKELVSRINAVMRRAPEHAKYLMHAHEASVKLAPLTKREREVLEQIALGRSNKHAAYALGISPRTVEIHRAHIMKKVGAHTLLEVMRVALAAPDFNASSEPH